MSSLQTSGLRLVDGETVVAYGVAGGVGRSVAKAFAGEGATIFLAGRTENSLDSVAREIKDAVVNASAGELVD